MQQGIVDFREFIESALATFLGTANLPARPIGSVPICGPQATNAYKFGESTGPSGSSESQLAVLASYQRFLA
jgi:hypothetical protein